MTNRLANLLWEQRVVRSSRTAPTTHPPGIPPHSGTPNGAFDAPCPKNSEVISRSAERTICAEFVRRVRVAGGVGC